MDILQQDQAGAQIRLTCDDVVAITNALNESLERLEEWEFDTRMGVTKAEARALLAAFRQIKTVQE